MYEPCDFNDQIQCEEVFRDEDYEEPIDGDEYRRHSKQVYSSRKEISKYQSRQRRAAEKKARARSRMFKERIRSEQLRERNCGAGAEEANSN